MGLTLLKQRTRLKMNVTQTNKGLSRNNFCFLDWT
jgi:hypothetical protein